MKMKVLIPYPESKQFPFCPKEVPFSWLNQEWAQHIHSQSLERLNERGGLHPVEIIGNIKKLSLKEMRYYGTVVAIREIEERLANDRK